MQLQINAMHTIATRFLTASTCLPAGNENHDAEIGVSRIVEALLESQIRTASSTLDTAISEHCRL